MALAAIACALLASAAEPPVAPDQEAAVAAVLDDFHDAAAKADGKRYFAHFAPNGIFLGTDATERWTLDAFKAFAEPYFEQGKGWTYVATERHVTVSNAGDVAWFDERLRNEKYGECRGTGVLVRNDGRWRVAQYNLTIPIPNEIGLEVVRMIREVG
jgi:uncharacterized protein (TIGR02246 family)